MRVPHNLQSGLSHDQGEEEGALSSMLTSPYSRSGGGGKKKVSLVIRSSFNLIRCGGIGGRGGIRGIKYEKPDELIIR